MDMTNYSFLLSYINVILILSLIRTAFLSSYKNIVLIFSLMRTGFLNFFIVACKIVDGE